MDRPIKPVFSIQDLLSLSPLFEPVVPSQKKNPVDVLGVLGELEILTRSHLPQAQSPSQAGSVPNSSLSNASVSVSANSTQSSAATHPARTQASHEAAEKLRALKAQIRPEYQGALNDPSVIEALLNLNNQPKKEEVKATFEAPPPPEVQATPKQSTHFKRSSRITTPVLRS